MCWWNSPDLTQPDRIARARELTLAMLNARSAAATICPSQVARSLAAEAGEETAWRGNMGSVHTAVDGLVCENRIGLSWKGVPMPARNGPYRIRRIDGDWR